MLITFVSAFHPSAADRPKIIFGSALALSGIRHVEGHSTQDGYDFWMNYVNEHGGLRIGSDSYSVEIHYRDDESSPDKTAQLLTDLIVADHVDFILSPYGSEASLAAAHVAEQYGVPMVISGGAADSIYNQGYHYSFTVMSPASKYLAGIIELAVKRTPRPLTVAICATRDPFALQVQQGAVESANDHGIRVVYNKSYDPDDPKAVLETVTKIKVANPDIVLNAGHFDEAENMQRDLKKQHVTAKMYGYTVGPDSSQFIKDLGRDAEGVLGSAQWSSTVTYIGAPGFYRSSSGYAAAFNSVFGHPPDYHNAEATAAGLAFQYALQDAGKLDREAVRNALAHLQVYTFFGLLKFDSRGVNVWKPMIVNQIQNGQLVTVYPYRLASAKPVYPAPPWQY